MSKRNIAISAVAAAILLMMIGTGSGDPCYVIFDQLGGTPTEGGCVYFKSGPDGNTLDSLTILNEGWNVEVCFGDQPDGDYIFEYSAICCPECSKATLTICHGGDPPCDVTAIITGICNN